MKQVILIIAVVACIMLLTGCEPEDVKRLHVQVTDPNGTLQVAAENVEDAIGPLTVLVKTLPIPHSNVILAALTAISAAIALIKSWREKQVTTALEEVVIGNEALKKTEGFEKEKFEKAQNAAQSVGTTAKITQIRNKLTAKK